jgi:uncharacterized protein
MACCVLMQGKHMRLSTFNHYVSDYPEPGQTLIHNTFSGAYVVVEDEQLAALRKADRDAALTEEELALAIDDELADPNVGVIVDSLEAEEAEFRAWFERRRSHGSLDVIVGVNLACNFDCPYCCQAEVMDGSVMKPATCDAVADWLAARAIERGLPEIFPMFVGGEPLLHPDRIERILQRLHENVAGRDIKITFGLITNGWFLDDSMIQRFLPYGLSCAQITLDGDETTHGKTRVSKKEGSDTFRRVFDNLIAASRHIRIAVNGNYQDDTLHGFAPLLDKLAAAGLPARNGVGFSPALALLSAPEGAGSGACTWAGSDTSLQVAFHDRILSLGYTANPLDKVGPCELHDRDSFAIDPDGRLFKCPGFLGHPEWAIGHTTTGLTTRYQELLRATPVATPCGGCSHRPNCGGGCVASEWIKAGTTGGVNCEKGYFDRIERDATIRNFLLASSDSIGSALENFPPPPRSLPIQPAAVAPATRGRRADALRVVNM